jgi:hypothetical protein
MPNNFNLEFLARNSTILTKQGVIRVHLQRLEDLTNCIIIYERDGAATTF